MSPIILLWKTKYLIKNAIACHQATNTITLGMALSLRKKCYWKACHKTTTNKTCTKRQILRLVLCKISILHKSQGYQGRRALQTLTGQWWEWVKGKWTWCRTNSWWLHRLMRRNIRIYREDFIYFNNKTWKKWSRLKDWQRE